MPIANELVTLLRYQVDNTGLRIFNRGMDSVGRGARGVLGYVRSIGTAARTGWVQGLRDGVVQHRALAASQRKALANTRAMAGGYSAMAGYLRTIIAGFGAIASARIADDWAGINARVELAVDPTEVKQALDELYAIAQRSGQEYVAIGDLFGRVARNQKELAISTEQSLQLTEIIGKAMTIGGGSSSAQQAALVQLAQAMGSGVLRGEELNSILEQSPRLALAVAKAFGVPVGKLKELGEKGKLTAKDLAKGLLAQAQEINAEFAKMPRTFGRGWTTIMNAYGRFINQLNRSTGAAERFNVIAGYIAENMREIVQVGAFTALAYALTLLRPVALAALAPFIRMAALLGGIFLLGEDIAVWARGGESLFGKVVGGFEEWSAVVDRIRDALQWVRDMIGDNSATMTQFVGKWGALLIVLYAIVRVLMSIGKLMVAVLLLSVRGLAVAMGVLLFSARAVGVAMAAMLVPVKAIGVAMLAWPLIRVLGWLLVIALALQGMYNNAGKLSEMIRQGWKRLVGDMEADIARLTEKLAAMVPDWVKDALRNATGGPGTAGQNPNDPTSGFGGSMFEPFNNKLKERFGKATQTPQSYSPSQNNQVTNEITINAQTNSPASLANAAANAAGDATTRSLTRGGLGRFTPNVEVSA